MSATDVALASGDAAPTGVQRVGAATPTRVQEPSSANVAVLDTGIDLDHPDLNAASGKNCVTPSAPPDDDSGHGTHVAGSIAAENDGAGVVGVAPGATTHAVKVLDQQGDGTTSTLICGIEWVTATHEDGNPSNDIAVANMSLAGPGSRVQSCSTTTDPLHRALCASTEQGVSYVAAAGNSGWAFDDPSVPDVPAAYPEVLTVTALSDSDGVGGGRGGAPGCSPGAGDDAYANFSNFASTAAGRSHTIAAPGVCIRSTLPAGGYGVQSGTSMAAPHVAGTVALCLGEPDRTCAGLSPAAIIQKLRSDAEAATLATSSFGFEGDPAHPDPDQPGYFGYLAWGGAPGQAPSAAPTPTLGEYQATAYALTRGTVFRDRGALARLHRDDARRLEVAAAKRGSGYVAEIRPTATLTAEERSSLNDLTVTYDGHVTGTGTTLSVRVFNFTTGGWDSIAGPVRGVTSDRRITWSPSTSPASYVSAEGRVRVSVMGSGANAFRTRTDQVRFTIEY